MRASEILNELYNPDIVSQKFKHKQQIGNYVYTAELVNDSMGPALKIQAFDKNTRIGRVYFTLRGDAASGGVESTGTKVDPGYQKQGVASTMYAYAKMLGNDIIRSNHQSRAGQKMWKSWDRTGDSEHLIK